MLPWQTNLTHQLEELHLIRCSLLQGEQFTFVHTPEDLAIWTSLLDAFTDSGGFISDSDDDGVVASLTHPPCQARFEVRVVGVQTWFEITLPRCTEVIEADAGYAARLITISIKGERVSRNAHERWNAEICARMSEMDEACVFPAYELLTHLTVILHQSQDSSSSPLAVVPPPISTGTAGPQLLYHALLVSHHLVSPTKRRTMQQLSSQLAIAGFAKVGYLGIMYAEGSREAVETFVREVKGMQWLALRVRFIEPVPDSSAGPASASGVENWDQRTRWVEMSKVGEVLEWMGMRGRESFVTNLGIGASSKQPR